ncbi:hypothetical protein [Variovorax sp. dw_308]|uniref:hypothetical protein n=1 Tax=Variovorax sp. dw_308 TaxID=2721546 RepID=UPI003527F7D0
MIVVAVVAILVAIALPDYSQYIKRSPKGRGPRRGVQGRRLAGALLHQKQRLHSTPTNTTKPVFTACSARCPRAALRATTSHWTRISVSYTMTGDYWCWSVAVGVELHVGLRDLEFPHTYNCCPRRSGGIFLPSPGRRNSSIAASPSTATLSKGSNAGSVSLTCRGCYWIQESELCWEKHEQAAHGLSR